MSKQVESKRMGKFVKALLVANLCFWIYFGVAQPLNRGLAMAVLKKFPRFNIQFISLNSRTVALKSRIKFSRSSSAI